MDPPESTTPESTDSRHWHPVSDRPFEGVFGLVAALSMTVGRRPTSRLLVRLANLDSADRVVDIGCGPGDAVRAAAATGASVTGVDPSRVMLRMGRSLSRGRANVSFEQGTAESLPLPDRSATVAWAVASAHHWSDVPAGLAEIRRVLVPGGRLLVAERLTHPGARGHAAHGLSETAADALVERATAAGFIDGRWEVHEAGRRTLAVVLGTAPGA